jgi:hypothetical protein
MFLRNVALSPNYAALQPRRLSHGCIIKAESNGEAVGDTSISRLLNTGKVVPALK